MKKEPSEHDAQNAEERAERVSDDTHARIAENIRHAREIVESMRERLERTRRRSGTFAVVRV